MEKQPREVPEKDKQTGEALRQKLGAEPCVWTERMLAALQSGVKGGKWFSLHDKSCHFRTLQRAWEQVSQRKGSGGIDGVTIADFTRHAERELKELQKQLQTRRYQPQAVKRQMIPKPGSREKRPLGIPSVRDRVVQTALTYTLQPIFEKGFHPQSYGFRPGKGCKEALREVNALLHQGYEWVVDADQKSYFDTLEHEILMRRVKEEVADGDTLRLIELFLKQGVMNEAQELEPTERGTPQGAVLSPLLSNIYLNPLDWQMAKEGFRMVRYADDYVVLCRSREEAQRALKQIQGWSQKNKLQLHPEKTRIVHHQDKGGFEFLGYRFERGKRYPRVKSLKKLRQSIREHTQRTNGSSLDRTIAKINPILRGWFEYYKHSHKTTFRPIDGWVRMRLRSILRKHHKRKGRGRGQDHVRWPNAYFAERGLFTLERAFAEACQSR